MADILTSYIKNGGMESILDGIFDRSGSKDGYVMAVLAALTLLDEVREMPEPNWELMKMKTLIIAEKHYAERSNK